MPPAKRASSSSSKSSSSKSGGQRATGQRATRAAASSGTKATATSAAKGARRTGTQAKSAASSTGRSARSGAKSTAATARDSAKSTKATAKAATTRAKRASGGDANLASVAEQLVKGAIKPGDLVMLTRERIQETLDDAASRGRVTRKDAEDLAAELVRRGRSQSNDLLGEIESLLKQGRGQIETATRRARNSEPVDRLARGVDRARRAAGVGSSFPILGYDDLNAGQVQSRLKDLGKPDLRKVLTYERKNANRKTVVAAIEKSLG